MVEPPDHVPTANDRHAESLGQTAAGTLDIPEALETRRLLAAIVESSDDAIISKDPAGIITSWNAGAERIYGYAAHEVIGRSVAILIPPELENDLPRIMQRVRRGERIDHYETVRVARDGRRLHMSVTISPLRDDDGRIIGASAIARDITERKREASRWRLLSTVGQAMTGILEPDALLRELARLLVPELADYCVTYILDDESVRRVGAVHADPGRQELVQRLLELPRIPVRDGHDVTVVIRSGEPILLPVIEPHTLERSARGDEHLHVLQSLEPRSALILPLHARGRMLGAVMLATTRASGRRYGEADLVLGRELAERAALALDNARLYREARSELRRREAAEESLRRRYRQLRALYLMTDAVGRAGGVEELLEHALRGLRGGLAVERAAILLADPDGTLRFAAEHGFSEAFRRTLEADPIPMPDAREPTPVVVPDVAAAAALPEAYRAALLGGGVRGAVIIPLTVGGRQTGQLLLGTGTPRPFTDEEIELAHTIAGTIAIAIVRLRNERSVLEAKAAAERANEAKAQFLGVMSHELRTPLNAVLGYAELLLLETKGPVNPAQKAQIERIRGSAQHQLELVDEILTYTRLEAGREEAKLMTTDARRVIRDVVELVKPEADAKGLRIDLDVPATPIQIVTDPAKLRQILLNLAGNATKYTTRGGVAIRASVAGSSLTVEVRDSGPGIPPDMLEHIFEPFTRVEAELTRSTAGTGLGLAIARRLAAMLGGEIRVSSRSGTGSAFTLEVPDLALRLPAAHATLPADIDERGHPEVR